MRRLRCQLRRQVEFRSLTHSCWRTDAYEYECTTAGLLSRAYTTCTNLVPHALQLSCACSCARVSWPARAPLLDKPTPTSYGRLATYYVVISYRCSAPYTYSTVLSTVQHYSCMQVRLRYVICTVLQYSTDYLKSYCTAVLSRSRVSPSSDAQLF